MTDEEYINFIVDERIELLLQRKRDKLETDMLGKVISAFQEEEGKIQLKVETTINLLVDQLIQEESKYTLRH